MVRGTRLLHWQRGRRRFGRCTADHAAPHGATSSHALSGSVGSARDHRSFQGVLGEQADPRFLLDVRPLLPVIQAEALTEETTADSFRRVFGVLIDQLPGEPWGRTQAMKERFGISHTARQSVSCPSRAWPPRPDTIVFSFDDIDPRFPLQHDFEKGPQDGSRRGSSRLAASNAR